MASYPIEILNFGQPAFELHHQVLKELNSVQEDFVYALPADRHKLWAAPFVRDEYQTEYVFQRLREYRQACKGFHPFLIALVHGSLASAKWSNLFGSRESAEGLAVCTTKGWGAHFAPPPLDVFLAYYFIRYTMNFISPKVTNHSETRGCFFDFKENKEDIKLSMRAGSLCDSCRATFEESIDGNIYESLLKMVKYLSDKANAEVNIVKKPKVFIGSSSEGLQIAEFLQLGLNRETETTIWSQGVFGLSQGTLESLVNAAKKFDYAILVLTPDDLITKKGRTGNSPRDNVLFELGLFMGALGRHKTFMVHCQHNHIELPSDLAGVTIANYQERSDRNVQAALGPVCTQLKLAMGLA